ncbi:SCP2 sterol-binding domain-containing protein [Ferdinandcohnia quinoae]|uniref:SCP2 sterol-binding domain-containing protein n=1 Tax=Fredinandcohnia quinoae TaxID=2918902 RepID=A0AAW5EBL1_9BACI|nr:SCP2 sterol-binding domain-containing protein [Fredinandcohnia sp. SECRCQ15]MCH1627357.1 SCP2 sterol-binding domain-containing protein [Fredinandcohnia sp. SECRCQ15]
MSKTINDDSLANVMEKIEEILNENPGPIEGINVVYQFEISGDEEALYQLQLGDSKAKVLIGSELKADCTLKLSFANFRLFLLGKLNGTMAFMTGKLKMNGDIGKALKLESLLQQYNMKDHLS